MFYDDIDTPPVRQPVDFLGNVLVVPDRLEEPALVVASRQAPLAAAAQPGLQIEVVERARADAHQRPGSGRHRIRHLLVEEDVGRAMLMEADCFHRPA
jgi:hypothetical protein